MKQLWSRILASFLAKENFRIARTLRLIESQPTLIGTHLTKGLLACAVCLCALATTGLAQVITGDVVGTVTDPQGAVIPNADVSIQNANTGETRNTQTNAEGEYVLNLLPNGNYSLSIAATGFQTLKKPGVALAVGDRLRVDGMLQPGTGEQTIEVKDTPPLLQSESSSVGSTVDEQTIQDVPLNGRNLTSLVTVQPGVNAGLPQSITNGSRPDDRRQSSEVSANGQPEFFNQNLLDGVDNNERFYGLGGIKPSLDAIQEIRVETNNFTADIGRAAGAVITVITKSGGNDFHGDFYEYFRNDVFNAFQYFTSPGARKPEWRQNQYGGSIGGPIKKDKTFFFFDFEQFRLVQGISSPQELVPSVADRQTIASAPDSIGKAIFQLYPLPNVPGTNYYVSSPNETQNITSLDARVDHRFSGSDTLFGRYSYNPSKTFFPSFFPAVDGVYPGGSGFIANGSFPGSNKTTAQGGQLNYTHVFNPRLLMELRTGYTRLDIDSQPINIGTNASAKFGIPNANIPEDPNATGFSAFHFLDGSADLGDQIAYPIENIGNTFQYNGDVIYSIGNHNVKIGAALIRRQLNYLQEFEPTGWFWFFSALDLGQDASPFLAFRQNVYSKEYLRSWETSAYAQDDWRILPSLTLNLGLRYDVFTPFTDALNRYSNFDLNTLAIVTGGTAGLSTDYKDFAPRLGFAEQVRPDFVVRGGYGISYYPSDFAAAVLLNNPPYINKITCSPAFGTCPTGTGTLELGPPISPKYLDPAVALATPGTGLGVVAKQTNWRNAYLQQFNLFAEKQFGPYVVTAGYVGSLGRRQANAGTGFHLNVAAPDPNGTIALVDGAVPHYYSQQLPGAGEIQYFENEATSNYNALQLIFARRYGTDLSFNANYTLSHGLNSFTGFENGGAADTWRLNYRYEYGSSDLDIRQRVAFTVNYNIPFGKSMNNLLGAVVKNWSLASISYWQTGLPFTVIDSNTPAGAYGDASVALRTNVVPGQSLYAPHKSVSSWLNPNAFTPPVLTDTTLTLGNESPNKLYGPHALQFDVSAYKTFKVWESLSMQFRAECFNISNTPNFATPNLAISAPATFGQILSTSYGTFPRVFQFALKGTF